MTAERNARVHCSHRPAQQLLLRGDYRIHLRFDSGLGSEQFHVRNLGEAVIP